MGHPNCKWVKLTSPVVALNSDNVSNTIHAKYSPIIKGGTPSEEMIKNQVPEGVNHLVFNCHGFEDKETYPAHLAIGTTITKDSVDFVMKPIAKILTLRVIWLSACNLGGNTGAQELCRKIAKTTICYVATQTLAMPDVSPPTNCIVDNKGMMSIYFGPEGEKLTRDFFVQYGIREKLFSIV